MVKKVNGQLLNIVDFFQPPKPDANSCSLSDRRSSFFQVKYCNADW